MRQCRGNCNISAGRFVTEPIKFVWSYDFHQKNMYYSVTGDYTEHSDTSLAVLQYQTPILVSVALLDDLLSNKVS